MEEGRSVFTILTGNPIERRPFRRPVRRWEDNIGIDLKEIVVNTRNWINSAQKWDYWKFVVNAALNFRVHKPWSYLVI